MRSPLRTRAWPFLRGLYERAAATRVQLLAAALAYYAAFSLGPLLLLLAGWLGVVLRTRPELAEQYRQALIDVLAQVLPLQVDTADLVSRSFDTVVGELNQGALLRTLVSIVVLVWASGNFFTSLQLALEVIFDVPVARAFWRKRLVAVALVMSVALVIAFEVVGGALMSVLHEVSRLLTTWLESLSIRPPGLPTGLQTGWALQVARLGVAIFAFTLTFRFLPRRRSTWAGAFSGALVSALGIAVLRTALLTTFNAERFNLVYGVITSLVALLLWLYLALLLLLFGGVVAAELSARRSPDGPAADLTDNPA